MNAVLLTLAILAQAPNPPAPVATPPEPEEITSETVHAFLLEYDKDMDGKLSRTEMPERFLRRFERADLDGDGFIDARELLTGRSSISREARRIEGLRITRRGLEKKTGILKPGEEVGFRVQSTLLQRLDKNHDGFADANELGSLIQQPGIVFGDRPHSMTLADAQALADSRALAQTSTGTPATDDILQHPTPRTEGAYRNLPSPFDPMLVPSATELPARPDMAEPVAQLDTEAPEPPATDQPHAAPARTTAPAAPAPGGAEALPSAEQILANLDKNKNGQLDRDEAVDQLAENFDKLDRNRDNMLSDKEIKRGLFLARMLGIKPKQDPRNYQTQP